MTAVLKPPFPYYGGKTMLAERIIDLLPEHRHYVEPYAGSLAVLLAKPRTPFETVNDLDGDLVNFWRVLRERRDELEEVCGLTPHSRAEHLSILDAVDTPVADPLERARRTWVLLTQGRSGGTSRRTAWRHFADPGTSTYSMPQYLAAYVARFGPAVARLHGVSLECRPALEIVAKYGRYDGVLLYVDPPYVQSARTSTGYRHEMTDDDHRELAGRTPQGTGARRAVWVHLAAVRPRAVPPLAPNHPGGGHRQRRRVAGPYRGPVVQPPAWRPVPAVRRRRSGVMTPTEHEGCALSQRMRRNPRAAAWGQAVAFLVLGVGLAICGGTAGLGLVVLIHLYSGRR